MAYGNLVTVKVAERLGRERQKLRQTARQMEGLHPSGPPDAAELLNSNLWYNWRMSNMRPRIAHIHLQKVRTLMEFLGVDSATVREMSAETKDEVYCVSVLMLYHCGLIYVPDFLHSAYKNSLHSIGGPLKRLRWACTRMISFLGSSKGLQGCLQTHLVREALISIWHQNQSLCQEARKSSKHPQEDQS